MASGKSFPIFPCRSGQAMSSASSDLTVPENPPRSKWSVVFWHTLGLGRPIVGDRLYGGDASDRLHLHAHSIEFRHPVTGEFVRMQRALKNH